MDLKLNNKVAVVLAASKGLGRAIAAALSAEGAKVIIGSRDETELAKQPPKYNSSPVTR